MEMGMRKLFDQGKVNVMDPIMCWDWSASDGASDDKLPEHGMLGYVVGPTSPDKKFNGHKMGDRARSCLDVLFHTGVVSVNEEWLREPDIEKVVWVMKGRK